MGGGVVRVPLLCLHARTESPGAAKWALQECSRRLVEESPGHASNSDPRGLRAGSESRNDRIPMRQIIGLSWPLTRRNKAPFPWSDASLVLAFSSYVPVNQRSRRPDPHSL